jgi:hypothetical protein
MVMSVRLAREDVVGMIEAAAARLTGGDLEAVVGMAMRGLMRGLLEERGIAAEETDGQTTPLSGGC